MDSLPQDLLVEVVTCLAAAYPTPIEDLKSVRSSCKSLFLASRARKVGRCMSVGIDSPLHWWDTKAYFQLLRRCATSGNTEASYILGSKKAYNQGRTCSGIRYLWRAMAGGHQGAAYLLGILLLEAKNEASRSLGVQILNRLDNKLDNGKDNIRKCRREAAEVLRKIGWKKLPVLRHSCENREHCRTVASGRDQWADGVETVYTFCSHVCRWKHEYQQLAKLV